jgi:hypothetical protein
MSDPSMRTLGNAAAEHDTRLRARRGLAIYFAVLVPLSAVLETLMIVDGALSWVWALMWTPAAASILDGVFRRFQELCGPEAMERSGIGGQALELACQPIGYTKRFGCEPRF